MHTSDNFCYNKQVKNDADGKVMSSSHPTEQVKKKARCDSHQLTAECGSCCCAMQLSAQSTT